ncbi:MAG: methyltransferase domain-containing protein [Euryarchaeota archaeon]|nr:methyltransferase domain-containing protein [Euryarchaeota archaeon]
MKLGLDRRRYERLAPFYDLLELPMELVAFSRWRRLLFAGLGGGRILEVGIGTGKNIPHHPGDTPVVGVDISLRMLRRAKARAERLGRRVELVLADVEALPFRDGSFDAAASSYVFCSVENPVRGLEEVRRVLRPGGRARFLEHMRSENPLVGALQDLLNPLVHILGPEINRRTLENIRSAGLRILRERRLLTSIFRLVDAGRR